MHCMRDSLIDNHDYDHSNKISDINSINLKFGGALQCKKKYVLVTL